MVTWPYKLYDALLDRWYRLRRKRDKRKLWPILVERTGNNFKQAKEAFLFHARNDKAWLYLERKGVSLEKTVDNFFISKPWD